VVSACVHGETTSRVSRFRVSRCFVLRSSFSSASFFILLVSYIEVTGLPWLKGHVNAANGLYSKKV